MYQAHKARGSGGFEEIPLLHCIPFENKKGVGNPAFAKFPNAFVRQRWARRCARSAF